MTVSECSGKFIDSLTRYYNINYVENIENMVCRADYFEHSESFAVSKKANLWVADSEEFLYLFKCENLTENIYSSCMDFVKSDWEKHAHIQKGHMYTYVTPVFIAESAEKKALKKLKRCRIYKNFRFSLWGWMEYHTALLLTGENKIYSNVRGRCVKKMLSKLFLEKN